MSGTVDVDGSGDTTVTISGTVTITWSNAPSGVYFGYGDGVGAGSTPLANTKLADITGGTDVTRGDPGSGGGAVYPDATIYQGEDGITFDGGLNQVLVGTSGSAEGVTLDVPIRADQPLGIYSNSGDSSPGDEPSVTVNQPRITTFEILLNGEDLAGGSVGEQDAANLNVDVVYNFEEAEDLELEVTNPNGLVIDNEVLGAQIVSGGSGTVSLDLSDQPEGTYTVAAFGTDDLDIGEASQTRTIEVTTQENVDIEFGSDTVTQGENIQFSVTQGTVLDTHVAAIEDSDFRDNIDADTSANIFRNVGDALSVGIVVENAGNGNINVLNPADIDSNNQATASAPITQGDQVFIDEADASGNSEHFVRYAFANMEIDTDTKSDGEIETQHLDTSSIGLDVSAANANIDTFAQGNDPTTEEDFEVEEGEITLDSPGAAYVAGAEVDVNGTAPSQMDNVAFYIRDEGNFELLEVVPGQNTIPVKADGTFEEEDADLTAGNDDGNDLISFPGTYRIGVIDAADADLNNDNTIDADLTTSEFNSGTSMQKSLRVTDQDLAADFTSVINGQIAEEDGDVDIEGTAQGSSGQDVLFVAVGQRGQRTTEVLNVESDSTFD
jgi:major cell surface glycoprotein (TIGR04216 family)